LRNFANAKAEKHNADSLIGWITKLWLLELEKSRNQKGGNNEPFVLPNKFFFILSVLLTDHLRTLSADNDKNKINKVFQDVINTQMMENNIDEMEFIIENIIVQYLKKYVELMKTKMNFDIVLLTFFRKIIENNQHLKIRINQFLKTFANTGSITIQQVFDYFDNFPQKQQNGGGFLGENASKFGTIGTNAVSKFGTIGTNFAKNFPQVNGALKVASVASKMTEPLMQYLPKMSMTKMLNNTAEPAENTDKIVPLPQTTTTTTTTITETENDMIIKEKNEVNAKIFKDIIEYFKGKITEILQMPESSKRLDLSILEKQINQHMNDRMDKEMQGKITEIIFDEDVISNIIFEILLTKYDNPKNPLFANLIAKYFHILSNKEVNLSESEMQKNSTEEFNHLHFVKFIEKEIEKPQLNEPTKQKGGQTVNEKINRQFTSGFLSALKFNKDTEEKIAEIFANLLSNNKYYELAVLEIIEDFISKTPFLYNNPRILLISFLTLMEKSSTIRFKILNMFNQCKETNKILPPEEIIRFLTYHPPKNEETIGGRFGTKKTKKRNNNNIKKRPKKTRKSTQ
jgi:hypothetical protein